MFSARALRRQRYTVNPFVVLSDVTIAVILILMFYFTALVNTMQKEKAHLTEELKKLKEEDAKRTLAINQSKAQVRDVLKDLRLQSYRDKITVDDEGDQQVFTFGAEVLFPRASYTLSDSGKRFLSLFGQALRNALKNVENHPEIQVQGHTDTRRWDNWMLSMNRALAVIKVFSEQTNLRRTHLSAAGYS